MGCKPLTLTRRSRQYSSGRYLLRQLKRLSFCLLSGSLFHVPSRWHPFPPCLSSLPLPLPPFLNFLFEVHLASSYVFNSLPFIP